MAEQSHEEWERRQQEKKEIAAGTAAGAGVTLGCLGYAIWPVIVVVLLIAAVLTLGFFGGC